MDSREKHRVRSPDPPPSPAEDSDESNEIAFLVGEDGQLHSLQEETREVRQPVSSPLQHNGMQSNRDESRIFTSTSSFQPHNENRVLQQTSDNLNGDQLALPCAAVNGKMPVKESVLALWSGDCKLPAAYHYTASRDSPKQDGPIQNHSDDMVCNICGKRYKYMSSFWKHRRDHEAKGEFFTAFLSRPDAAKNTTGMVLPSAAGIKALISQKLSDRSGKLCPRKEVNLVSESRPIMVKMEKSSPSNSSQGKFHDKGCGSVAESRLSVIKAEGAPYCAAGKVSLPSIYNVALSDLSPAARSGPLPDDFFSCEICGKKYKYKSSFWKHIEDHKNYVVDSTASDQGWNRIAASQLTEKPAYKESVRKVRMEVQHLNLLPIRDAKLQVHTANKGQRTLDFDQKHSLYNDPIRNSDFSIGQLSNTCQLCGASFSRKSGLVDHIQFVHQRYRPHVCTLCDQKFRRPSELKRHVQRCHDNCVSDIQVRDVTSLEKARTVENRLLKLPAAPQTRATHVKETAGDTPVRVSSQDHLPKIQISNVTSLIKYYIVENDDKKSSGEVKLVQGSANQTETGRITSAKNKKTLKKPSRVRSCSLCGKKYLHYSILWKHKRMHGGKKKQFCLLCGSGFFRSKDLDIHVKSEHHQALKYKCPHCEKGFNRPIDAQKHIIIRHTDLENFICRICNTSTVSASELQNHVKKFHSPKVPCTQCSSIFENELQFNRHARKH